MTLKTEIKPGKAAVKVNRAAEESKNCVSL